jgi:hypothetical protein
MEILGKKSGGCFRTLASCLGFLDATLGHEEVHQAAHDVVIRVAD